MAPRRGTNFIPIGYNKNIEVGSGLTASDVYGPGVRGQKTETIRLDATPVPSGITSINGDSTPAQLLAIGTAGTDANIANSGATRTVNIPSASLTARGLVTIGVQSFGGNKTFLGITRFDANVSQRLTVIAATGALNASQGNVKVANGATNITLTLPTPVGNSGLEFYIGRDTGSTGAITILPGAGQIQGITGTLGATTSLANIGSFGGRVIFVSNGTNWLRKMNG